MSSRWRSSSTSERGRAIRALPLCLAFAFAAAAVGCTAHDLSTPSNAAPPSAVKPRKSAPAPVAWTPPAPPTRIAFDHKFHLSRGVGCADCHEGTDKAERAAMPTVEFCMNCHEEIDEKKPKEKTVAAFLDADGKTPRWSNVTAQSPDIAFSHKTHLDKKLECADCHKAVEETIAVSTKALFLDMETCVRCHEAKQAKTDCAVCHKQAAKRLAEGKGPFWPPANHDAGWKAGHGPVVHVTAPRTRAEKCDDCHGKPQFPEAGNCATCHAATKPASHDQAWRGAHGADVRGDFGSVAERCGTCHDSAVFPAQLTCDTCHAATKPASHTHLWRTLHGQAVRRDPDTESGRCAFCHQQPVFPTESRCSGCHATEAPRDHTQSWRVDGGHGLSAAMDRARCAACHTADTCSACHATVEPRSHAGNWGAPRDRHCVNCHLPLNGSSSEGCGVCHRGTPSHASAPSMPSEPPHRPDMTCRKCHFGPKNLKHADNGINCVNCHR